MIKRIVFEIYRRRLIKSASCKTSVCRDVRRCNGFCSDNCAVCKLRWSDDETDAVEGFVGRE